MFHKCNGLTSLDLSNWNTSKVINMRYMFYFCNNLTSLDLSSFNTSNVTDMGFMFSGCNKLTSLDLSNWDITLDTSKPSSYTSMFNNCTSLSEIKMCNCSESTIQFITDRLNDARILSNVTIITECESNDKVNSLSCNFNKSTPITDLYFDMDNLPEAEGYWWVGLSYNPNQEGDCNNCNWSNGDLQICLYENRYDGIMNGEITNLEQVNGLYHLHLDTPLYFICGEANSHLERYYLIASCDDTISFRWDGNATDSFEFELETRTRNVYREDCKDNGDGTYTYTTTLQDMEIEKLTYCSYVFVHNHNLVELIKFPCTDNVTEMVNMFQSCRSLTSLDLSSFNVSNVTDMSNMFISCSNLERLNLNGWKLNDMVNTDRMFAYCDNLREIYLKNSDETTYMKIQDAVIQSGINATIITK
jgi:surface protein